MQQKVWFLLVICLIFGLQSCSSDVELHKVMDEDGQLLEEFYRNRETYAKQGLYKAYYAESGKLMETVQFENNNMEGEYIRFDENGDTLSVAMMKNGVYEGVFKEYYPKNKIKQLYYHVNGKIKGHFKEFYESGALKGNILFEDNNENGAFVEYHENGKKMYEGTYRDGMEEGELLRYDTNGELIQKMDCVITTARQGKDKDGKPKMMTYSLCTTTWKKEGISDEMLRK